MVLLIQLRKILTDLCLSEINSISVNNKQELILPFLLKILQMTPALMKKETLMMVKRILKEVTKMMVKMPMRVMKEKMMRKNISTQNGTKFLQIRFGNPSEINT